MKGIDQAVADAANDAYVNRPRSDIAARSRCIQVRGATGFSALPVAQLQPSSQLCNQYLALPHAGIRARWRFIRKIRAMDVGRDLTCTLCAMGSGDMVSSE